METDSPFFTASLAGIGGTIKQQCEDFTVEEIPAYEPSGQGEHLFLWIEKRDLSGEQLLQRLARDFKISYREIGMAGLKDRSAVTRQYVSVPAKCEERLAALNLEQYHILHAKRHTNKLKTGHLRGNRFSILVRDVFSESFEYSLQIAKQITKYGFPNYFGRQRFGFEGDNATLGLRLLRGETTPKELPARRRKFLLRMALSSVQSHLFNIFLAKKIRGGTVSKVLAGDVMQVLASGGKFVVEEVPREAARLMAGEIGITGPIFGPKMHLPTGQTAEMEAKVLSEAGLSREHFKQFPKLTAGTRRLLMIKPEDLSFQQEPTGMRFQFTLPPGCYATSLMHEFQKNDDSHPFLNQKSS